MSDTIQEGVVWKFSADTSELVAAYQKAATGAQQAAVAAEGFAETAADALNIQAEAAKTATTAITASTAAQQTAATVAAAAADAMSKLQQTSKNVTGALSTEAATAAKVATVLHEVAAATAATSNAQVVNRAAVSSTAQATESARKTTGDATHALTMQADAAATAAVALNVSAKAHGAHGASAHGNALAMMEFVHVGRAVIDSAMAGANPLRTLAMEGGRLQIAFSAAGGVNKVLGIFGDLLAKVLNPTTLITAALAAMGAAGAYAFLGWENQIAKLQGALNGIGRATGVTATQLAQMAVGAAPGSRMTAGQAVGLTAGFAETGRFDPQMLPQLLQQSKALSLATGMSLDEAGAALAKGLKDPISGSDDLNKSLGMLDDRTRQLIKSQQQSLDIFGAQKTMLDAVAKVTGQAADQTWGLSRAWEGIKNAASGASDAVGQALQESLAPTLDQRIKNLHGTQAATANDWLPTYFNSGSYQSDSTVDLHELLRMRAYNEQHTAAVGADARSNQTSIAAGDIVRSVLPDIMQRQELQDKATALQSAIADPEVLAKMGVSAEEARRALGDLQGQLAEFPDVAGNATRQIKQLIADSQLNIAATMARTAADRASIDAQREYVDVMRRTGDRANAAAAAHTKLAEAIAQGTKAAEDNLRSATDQARLAKLNPYDAAMQQIANKYRDLNDKTVIPPTTQPAASGPAAIATAATDLETAAKAIRKMESGSEAGDYGIVGPWNKEGTDRPYGAYQVMGANIPSWTKQFYGQSLTSDQFLANPAAQDAVFNGQFGAYASRYGYAGASRAWFAGPGGMNNVGATDALGTSVGSYGSKFAGLTGQSGAVPLTIPSAPNAAAVNQQAQQLEQNSKIWELTQKPLRDLNDQIDAQDRMLKVQIATWGESTAQVEAATKQQELVNKYMQDGVPISDALQQNIAKVAQRYGEAQAASKDFAETQNALKSVSDTVAGSFVGLIEHTENWRQALAKLLQTLETESLNGILTGSGPLAALFGTQQGGAAQGGVGGLLTSGLSALFGLRTGTSSATNLGAAGGASGSGTSIFSTLFSGLGSMARGLSGLFESSGTPTSNGLFTSADSLFAGFYASGGIIPQGRWGIVGERGPEIIVGGAGGSSIVPMSRAQMAGQGNVTNHFYITTPDANSFKQSTAQIGGMITRAAQRGARVM